MKERPILFSAPMVRAILEDRKTQTRRIVKLPDDAGHVQYWAPPSGRAQPGYADPGVNYWTPRGNNLDACPFGQLGDRIWVRETWQHSNYPHGPLRPNCHIFYRADYFDDPHGMDGEKSPEGKYRDWKPSIHMPRWASRILLEITGVRVEQLNDISDKGPQNDCTAEGVFHCGMPVPTHEEWSRSEFKSSEKFMYRQLWESINGPGSWAANPWVWCIEFKRVAA